MENNINPTDIIYIENLIKAGFTKLQAETLIKVMREIQKEYLENKWNYLDD